MKANFIDIPPNNTLLSARALKQELPLSPDLADQIKLTRQRITQTLLERNNEKFLAIVGPCSVHNLEATYQYACQLSKLATQLPYLSVVMRCYFSKPRSAHGWKGWLSDPHLDGSNDINYALVEARRLLIKINSLGLPTATEFLNLNAHLYYADLISWAAIGARTAQSQLHRELASLLNMPIGIKNTTSGDINAAIDAIMVAQKAHCFMLTNQDGQLVQTESRGNPRAHVVLRGGGTGTNYSCEHIQSCYNLLQANGIASRILVDCSHGNAQTQPDGQLQALENVIQQKQQGDHRIAGIMLESFLQGGKQPFSSHPLPQLSVTDPCLSWEQTQQMLITLNDAFTKK